VKKNNLETCAECKEFPCTKLKGWDLHDSFICHRVSLLNLESIKEKGIIKFYEQQGKRIRLLETFLEHFNEGRSKSFYCISTALLQIRDLEMTLKLAEEKIINEKVNPNDLKAKSKILKDLINKKAEENSVLLKLRRK
jgi:hypothetical protein